uniref:Fatty acid desaturase domain-containing protein n=1 Tax=Trieres chinensis TaxID=1514140 RepID=A0A7S1ZL28_TRICV|mmetsp:Transcript_28186/g.57623  ORF Transcript_28186/g.57623 Transcript_28186/m.57623 type:complete len:438 (+) Transcript_28186:76-1389(+)|eukprot:CAMPEP_0183295302 /NCGR_PEP_ID=MMETSP0160_2-20130417/3300_1 /TAXON_ID=2839 ORGANISM="Odontella Sinensis, Strain Grunow 1884" /NCGR_SAMPLE_ID=MMETSP0160_2 /ASSEMBLY_ACC=CAM_ASM_000250 /LENGTH=437 /DNA_ID=CAMNT_0025456765 /DNA_START=76 /DNA_END=1389 /DNA_ORIENTATION=-
MGKGGRAEVGEKRALPIGSTPSKRVGEDGTWVSQYNPLDPKAPKLPSKGEIKAVIPKACFERSAMHSMYFVFRDSAMSAALIYATSLVLSTDLPSNLLSTEALVWFLGWNFYAFWQGAIWTGHWVLGHECGHGAFSSTQTFNDIVGFIIHQALLVPYFAWQYTHAKHHRRTNNLVDGESHVPSTGKENGLGDNNERLSFYAVLHEAMGDGAFAVWQIFTHLVIGWPLYLLGFASTGRLANDGSFLEDGEFMDHFRPGSKMFPAKISGKITLSTVTLLATLAGLVKLSVDYGFLTVFLWYTAPYMWVNAWLVLYTWLQHNDPSVPQYGADEWTWVKGALSTIDRPYGIFDFFHHKIGSTHVAHHLFHEMPFYRADEATAAIKAYLEPMGLYNYDPTPWYMAMWRIAKTCHYVEGIEGIQYYRSLEDIPRSSEIKKKVA